ncbi:MAG: rhodanese-like domain-containing protein [Flavobacteriales bacterium]|nr:rhodanese-like domain-containing protein [Flavobacteriales bacterium]
MLQYRCMNDGAAFKNYPSAIEKLQKEGLNSLPYIIINNQIVLSGEYPVKSQWKKWMGQSITEICPTTTQEWVKNGALLVDVREEDEVNELSYDVTNSINIPLSEFEERFTEIPKDQDVVMVCRGGGRSLRATGFLINNGYDAQRVVNMKSGIIRWVEKGFPTKGNKLSAQSDTSGGCCGSAPTPKIQSSCDSSPNADSGKCC